MINLLDEILVIRESLPIFYYNRDPAIALSDDQYLLQSGFFVALSQFANEMSHDKIKYIILENRLYALDEISDIMLIFGNQEKMSPEILEKLKADIVKAANYLNYLTEKHKISKTFLSEKVLNDVANDFGEYLKSEDLVEDDTPFDPKKSRSMMQKFIFKSIGYVPGQCNIGPAERLKRLLMGLPFYMVAIVGALLIFFLDANPWWAVTLIVPFFIAFQGTYQYFFRFCVVNGLTKKYQMR